jgi:hypothetical protein
MPDRARIDQSLEAGKCLFQPRPPAPMQKIEINPVGLQPAGEIFLLFA